MQVDLLGPVSIMRTFATPATVERTAEHVARSTARLAFLVMPIDGEMRSWHYGREMSLGEGDFALYDSAAPCRLLLASDNEAISLAIPYRLLTLHIPEPDGLFARRISGRDGFGTAVSTMLRGVWRHVEQGLPAELGPNVAKTLLDLLATCYALEAGTDAAESSMARTRRAQVKRHIESRLRDPDLNAVTIAEALHLSPRYVRMVFAAEGESVSAYILRRRLEECARQLGDRLWQGRSITETALQWGFTSVAHFTRSFKGHFGVTPSWYRRAGSAVGAGQPQHER